jgi:small subunit ribosomal protein S6
VRPYEIVIILDASLDEEAIRGLVDRATDAIRARGGNPGRVDRWGKRRFAYELKHRSEGYYVLVEVTAEPGALADVDRMLSLADEVLRHKVIRLPEAAAGLRSTPPPEAAGAAEGELTSKRS